MDGTGALYFDAQAIDVLYDKCTGIEILPPRREDLENNQLPLARRLNAIEHNYLWNNNFTAQEILGFMKSQIHLFNPQHWLMELFRVMVCTESTDTYGNRMTLDNRVFRVAKTRCGIMPSSVVSKGYRAPLFQAYSFYVFKTHL